MAIRYQPTGYGEAVQKVAQEAGAAVAAREAAKISAQLEADRESQVRSMEFEKQMKDIDQQFELEKFARSKAWDIEKMETASRIDFEYDEKKRIQKKAEFDARNKSLDEALERDDLDSDDYKKQKELLKLKYFDMDEAAKALYQPPTKEEMMLKMLGQKGGMPTASATTQPVKQPSFKILGQTEQGVMMETPTGDVQTMVPEQKYRVRFGKEERVLSGQELMSVDPSSGQPVFNFVEMVGPYQSPTVQTVQNAMKQSLQRGGFLPAGMKEAPSWLIESRQNPVEIAKVDKTLNTVSKSVDTTKSFTLVQEYISDLEKLTPLNPEQETKKNDLLNKLKKQRKSLASKEKPLAGLQLGYGRTTKPSMSGA